MSDPEQPKGRRSRREEGGPERLYLLASDQKQKPDEHVPLDVVTLILSRGEPSASLQPEQASIVQICAYPLSVAELSAYLKLPVSVVMVVLAELLAGGHVEARAPATQTKSVPDIQLLEAVMHGLQNL
ncbi:DUF742 domain-containing protein [Streptomyces albiaxialis]|uniref:DUF742 domain-containing protein n=1 Tax=Streptomyces albiaxialis TaxID=329523 RepID=A0ABN2VHB3_9ACTN